jgi:hypothetical protein
MDDADESHTATVGATSVRAPEVEACGDYNEKCDVWSYAFVVRNLVSITNFNHVDAPTDTISTADEPAYLEELKSSLRQDIFKKRTDCLTDLHKSQMFEIIENHCLFLDHDKRGTMAQILNDLWVLFGTSDRNYLCPERRRDWVSRLQDLVNIHNANKTQQNQ